MKGIKILLFAIAVALCGIAISTMNIFGFIGGGLGLVIAIAGLYKKD